MSDLAGCIQAAIDAGQVDRTRGARAQDIFAEQVDRYVAQGHAPEAARVLAGDDLLESIANNAQRRRHTALAQLRDLAEAEASYRGAATEQPDRILQHIEATDREATALTQSFMAGISDMLARHRTDVIGRVRDRAGVQDLVRELFGEASGNTAAREFSRAVSATFERARNMFNMLGGDIRRLDDFGLPHSHNARAIEATGFEGWFARIWDERMIDWSRIENFQTGRPFAAERDALPNRAEAERFLREVYDSVVSGGWSRRDPSLQPGGMALYRRRSEHRVLHFRSADAWMAYNDAFGAANPFEAITGHLQAMARDIALMRNFGPNPRAGVEFRAQIMEREAALASGPRAARIRAVAARKANKARTMLRHVTGEVNRPVDGFFSAFLAGSRNLLTAAQLGAAPLSQVNDTVTVWLAARAVAMSPNAPMLRTIESMTSRISVDEARAMGYVLDTWFHTGAAKARFVGDVWAPEWTERISNSVLRANGLAFMTDHSRQALRVTFSLELAEQAGRGFSDLDPRLRSFLSDRGLTAAEWDLLRDPRAMFTSERGGRYITPHWFAENAPMPRGEAERLAMKLGGIIEDHVEFGIPTASVRGRATLMGDARPGSFSGELLRSSLMYKSYVLSLMFNQIRRVAQLRDNGTRAAYIASYVAGMTALGALAVQLKEIARGRDPRPMDTPAFLGAAVLQGGGVGIFGDFFSASTSRAGGGFSETLAGPVVGLASDVSRAVGSNIARMSEGRDPLIGRDIANLGRRYNPLATFQPLIPVPTRLAMDRLVWDRLQDMLDPEAGQQWRDYERRIRRDFGTQSFWRRGETAPDRAPDLANATRGSR